MKGVSVSWAGTLYRKLEALCIEVEENMYQDAVKYMENQVHTIGTSVKKFYSDILQDLSEDHTDVVERQSVGSIYNSSKFQKSEVGVEDVSMDVDMENATDGLEAEPVQNQVDFFRSSGDSHFTSSHERCLSNEHGNHSMQIDEKTTDLAGSTFTENLCMDDNAGQRSYSAATVSRVNNETAINCPPCEIDQQPPESSIPVHVNHLDLSLSPETEVCCGSVQISEYNYETAINCPPCDICSNQSLFKTEGPPGSAVAYNTELGMDSLEQSSESSEVPMHPSGPPGSAVAHSTELGTDSLKQSSESSEVPIHPSKPNPEERCIIMDASKCHLTSQTESKYKSYRRKIRHAFLPAAKSERELEYEQLALCRTSPVLQANSQVVMPCSHDDDSEWEFV